MLQLDDSGARQLLRLPQLRQQRVVLVAIDRQPDSVIAATSSWLRAPSSPVTSGSPPSNRARQKSSKHGVWVLPAGSNSNVSLVESFASLSSVAPSAAVLQTAWLFPLNGIGRYLHPDHRRSGDSTSSH